MTEPEWFVLVVERRAARRLTSDNVQQRFGLSPRQAEVALLLAQGHTTADIAKMLDLTTHTVRHHAEQVLQRLNVRTRQQAMVRLRDGTARGPKARPQRGIFPAVSSLQPGGHKARMRGQASACALPVVPGVGPTTPNHRATMPSLRTALRVLSLRSSPRRSSALPFRPSNGQRHGRLRR